MSQFGHPGESEHSRQGQQQQQQQQPPPRIQHLHQDESSESEHSRDQSGHESQQQIEAGPSRTRPTRLGSRSVSQLSQSQLDRKRANDREAQRAIRRRTRDQIESLTRVNAELTHRLDISEHQRRDLQEENRRLQDDLRAGVLPGSSYLASAGSREGSCLDNISKLSCSC